MHHCLYTLEYVKVACIQLYTVKNGIKMDDQSVFGYVTITNNAKQYVEE